MTRATEQTSRENFSGAAQLPQSLGELIRANATKHPWALAVSEGTRQLTFGELDKAADQVSAALIGQGVQHGDAVALLMPNSIEWLTSAIGAARIGAVVVPLNTWYQEDELRYVLEHSRAVALIAEKSIGRHDLIAKLERVCEGRGTQVPGGSRLPHLRTVVVCGAQRRGFLDWERFLGEGASCMPRVPHAEELVEPADDLFVIYTSGSTAKPKGVLLQHAASIANAYEIGVRQGVDSSDRTWIVQPLFWALAAVNMLLSSWSHGSAVVLQRVFDAHESLQLIEKASITRAYAIGNITHALIGLPEFEDANLESLTKGVALFTPEDRRIALNKLKMDSFVSLYGSTETHAVCFSAHWQDPVERRLRDCGTALPGWEWRLAEPGTDEILHGSSGIGELHVRGPLTRGYLNDPQQTREVIDSDGYFHTGDIVSIDVEGRLEFVGRTGDMIKTGGINVAPSDVEETLSGHPSVVQAHVVGLPDTVRGQIVAAIIEPRGDIDSDELLRWMRDRTASFKLPRRIQFVTADEIPRLPNGKVARKILPSLFDR